MKLQILATLAAAAFVPAFAAAQPRPTAEPAAPPKLLVVISVDQFSADLYNEYRQYFTGGLARLSRGIVFPMGFQSHAATETCPGHSTILTGDRPARTGIIANEWIDQGAARADKKIGSGLQAVPVVYLTPERRAELEGVDLAEIAITSGVTLADGQAPDRVFTLPEIGGVAVVVNLAEGEKCERCWQVLTEVGDDKDHPTLCRRCSDAVGTLESTAA